MASTSSFRASSSFTPSIPQTSTYDVFLSFRGEDTRYNFTDHLYKALGRRGIRTFRDDKLRRGEAIAPELLKAIEESRSSVIVFSENYAHSRWCLDELVKIMECQKDPAHAVFPIFYHVDPSHVRKQEGSFGEAFAGYEENWKDKIPRWRRALTEAANLSGWHLLDGYESNQIKEITDDIFRRLKCKRLDDGANLVGIDSHVKEMILRLRMESSDVRIVGIYGVGGIGKTTIAKVIYNKLSCEFDCMSFLENIREVSNTQALSHLQNQLLCDILEGEGSQNINGVAHRASIIEAILLAKRAFIVLDDVDDVDQLECLLRNRGWLGEGSRVIITTRNKHVLTHQEVDDLYEVKELNSEEACELFSLYAFKQNLLKSDYRNLSSRVVGYCQGLPLALKVLGSLLFNKTIPQWESELNKLDREPERKIHNVLKRSYDGLDRIEKNIFLDVACFFKGEDRDFVSRILDGCDFHPERGIRNLNDLCLITLPYNQICMHDLIQQTGWEIVHENFPDEPNKWSRLWDPCDFERALTAYEGIKRVETISLDLSKLKGVLDVNSNAFAKMTRLRLLKVYSGFHSYHGYERINWGDEKCCCYHVMSHASKMQLGWGFKFPSYELRYLCWDGYPLDFLPSNFDGGKLVELHLHYSNIKQLWLGKYLERLKVIDLSCSRKLIQMPEFSSMPNLEELILNDCVSLIDIHPSVGNMKNLTTLSLRRCDKIKDLPDSIGDLESLEILDLSYCSKFEKFPEKGGNLKSLKKLCFYGTAIKDLPDSIGDLESLRILNLSYCSKFEKFPEKGGNLKSLMKLGLKNTAIKDLPDSIGDLESLRILNLSNCSKFEKFPEKGGNLKSLMKLGLKNTAIKDLPNISRLKFLKRLTLCGCSDLWEGLISNQLCNLQKLNISQCKMAGQILVLPSSLEEIDAHHFTSKEDLSGLLWLCHLNWLKSTTEELKSWKLSARIPESSGIQEWIRYQNLGSQVTAKLPINWYEDPDFLGFFVSCVYRHITSVGPGHFKLECELYLHGNNVFGGFKDEYSYTSIEKCDCNPTANGSGLTMPMYWQGYYGPPNGLPHLHQQSLLRPPPVLSMPPMQYPGFNASLQPGAPNLPGSNLPEYSSPLLPTSSGSLNLTSTSLSPSTLPSNLPSSMPSILPSSMPSILPSSMPSILPSTLPSALPPVPSAALASETLSSLMPNKVPNPTLPSVTLGISLPLVTPLNTSSSEINAIAPPISNKPNAVSGPTLPYQTISQSIPSVGTSSPNHPEIAAPSLVTPGQLLQSGPTTISSSPSSQTAHKDVEVVQVSSSASQESSVPVSAEAQPPILPLPVPSRTVQKLNGAPFQGRHGYRGRGRGTGGSRPVTKFTEDFDFMAMNEKFKKDEVWGHLGKGNKSQSRDKEVDGKVSDEDDYEDEDDAELPKFEVKPIYNKDDFFDSLSCNALDHDSHNGRTRFSEQMKIDTETFGDFPRHRGGRGGRGPNRGGRGRGPYYGRGYGYVGRGRGRAMPSRGP